MYVLEGNFVTCGLGRARAGKERETHGRRGARADAWGEPWGASEAGVAERDLEDQGAGGPQTVSSVVLG